MASIITYEYFNGTKGLPQSATAAGQTLLAQFITQFEPMFLRETLGYELAKLLVANQASPDAKWKDLMDGVEFTNSYGRLDKWVGFKDTTNKLSPIANFVFYQFVKDGITQQSGIGAVQPEAENATRVYPQLRLCEVWNEMVCQVKILHDYLRLNASIYPEFNYYTPTRVTQKINSFGL